MTDLVSVIIPAFNAAPTLERAVASALAQTHQAIRVIIVNDGSRDDTGPVARMLAAHDDRITVITHEATLGAGAARNTGIAAATGRFVAFLDADDEWHVTKLAQQVALMNKAGTTFCYTGFERIFPDGRQRVVRVPTTITYRRLLNGNVVCCSSVVVLRSAQGDCRFPDLTRRQDFAMWLDLLRQGATGVGVDEPLVRYHVTAASLSSDRWASLSATYAVYRRHLGLSAPRAVWHMCRHLLQRLLRG